MYLFPEVYQPKRTKKITSFSNPLTGAFYSNHQFLNHCKNVPKSISDLEHIKQIKNQPVNSQSIKIQKPYQNKNFYSKEQKQRIQRQIRAVHATARMAQPIKKNTYQSVIFNKKCKKALDSETIERLSKTNLSKTFNKSFVSTRLTAFSQQQTSRLSKNAQHISIQPQKAIATFNCIEILILDLLSEKQDFKTKIVCINLQKYYRSFFKKQLSGHFTWQFLNKIQYYIKELIQKQILDNSIDQHLYPIEMFTISSKMTFLNKLIELETKKTLTNQDHIRTLIRFYCVPSKQFRQSCLRDIILMLSVQLYEKFNCSRQQQYILLDEGGQQINQILQIKFSTKKLFISSKKNFHKNYNNYIKFLDQFYREGQKLNFTENIKLNFRNRLAQGKYDDAYFNYTENYEIQKLKRLTELQNAQSILKRRVQTHRANKFVPKQYIFSHLDNIQAKTKKSQSKFELVQGNIPELPDKFKIQDNSNFWKSNNNIKSLQKSPSPNRSKSLNKSQIQHQSQSSQIQKQKLKQFLKYKPQTLNASLQNQFKQQFRDLIRKNDIYDFRFNHCFKNRVMKQVLKDHFPHFRDKEEEQICKIIKAIKSMELTTNDLEQQIQQNQNSFPDQQITIQHEYQNNFSMIQKQIHLQNSVTWEQFKNLKISVSCSQPKKVIMNFIGKYLNFNEFGELNKQQLFEQIRIILGSKPQSPTVEIIAEIIWSWFEANSIIENGCIRKATLQSWYEKYKIVYCLLISLIFGINHQSIIDLAYQVLV